MTTQTHECHPRDTKEQLYDVRLHDVELHDVANTCFANILQNKIGILVLVFVMRPKFD